MIRTCILVLALLVDSEDADSCNSYDGDLTKMLACLVSTLCGSILLRGFTSARYARAAKVAVSSGYH